MAAIYNNSPNQIIKNRPSRSSSSSSNKDNKKRYDHLNSHIAAVCKKRCTAQNSSAAIGLFSKQSFSLGDVVFSETPCLAFSSDGFCVFCTRRHSELAIHSSVFESRVSDMGTQYFSPNYIKFVNIVFES